MVANTHNDELSHPHCRNHLRSDMWYAVQELLSCKICAVRLLSAAPLPAQWLRLCAVWRAHLSLLLEVALSNMQQASALLRV